MPQLPCKAAVGTRVQLDREFAVSLFDFELCRGGLDAQGVVVCRLHNHICGRKSVRGGGEKVGGKRAGRWALDWGQVELCTATNYVEVAGLRNARLGTYPCAWLVQFTIR
jgi:hypothetical protein